MCCVRSRLNNCTLCLCVSCACPPLLLIYLLTYLLTYLFISSLIYLFYKQRNVLGQGTASWHASPRDIVHVVGMLRFMSDINLPSSPTPLYSVLVSMSVFLILSTVFYSINFPGNSPFSPSGLIFALLVPSAIYLFMEVSFNPDIIPSGWLGSKHQHTN